MQWEQSRLPEDKGGCINQTDDTGLLWKTIWAKTICYENGKPNWNAINILSDIVYWYRPTEIRDEVTGNFVTFYDWYPIESCNIDNIYFSFDKDAIEDTYNNKDKVNIFLPKISRKGDDIRVSPMLIKGGPNTFSVLYTTLVEGVTPEIS